MLRGCISGKELTEPVLQFTMMSLLFGPPGCLASRHSSSRIKALCRSGKCDAGHGFKVLEMERKLPTGKTAGHVFRRLDVSGEDKISNKVQEAKGEVKERVGGATGDEDLQAEGAADKTKSNLKQAGEKVKDAFRSSTGYLNRPPGTSSC